jgi:hypothetical protein
MNLRLFFIGCIFIQNSCFSQEHAVLKVDKVKSFFDGSLKYLVETQCDTTIYGIKYKGEWEVFMELSEPFFFIGGKQKKRDSNCFTLAAIHNFLSEIYLADTSQTQLKPTLSSAFAEVQTFRNGERFNFWKLLPPKRDYKFGKEPSPIPLVRRPTNFRLRNRFVNKTTNVPEDSDDTSLGNLASFYHNEIFGDSAKIIESAKYDEYLDQNRKNRNWFNIIFHGLPNSGAFLTWHGKEHEFKYWNKLRSLINGGFVFLPISPSFPKAYKPWTPFMANEVDIVVNANVLTYLAKTNQINKSIGKKGAVYVINELLKREQWWNSAIYYPNAYHIHYAVSRAYAAGVDDLQKPCEIILKHLWQTQKVDGSFESSNWLNNRDKIQSTTYALHAMFDLKSKGLEVPKQNIDKAVTYLLSKAKTENNISWDGGVYFTGGTLVRGIMIWKSDAYTTAMIAKCLQKWLKIQN